jgi:hypothetical protein
VDPSGKFAFIPLLIVGLAGGALGGLGYYAIQSYMHADPCTGQMNWDLNQAAFWSGAGAVLGAAIGAGIYGGWWVGVQFGWWGTTGTSIAAAQTAERAARVTYDASLTGTRIAGATDARGNISLNPSLPRAERLAALYHERVHAYFTPHGPLETIRQDFRMAAYRNSALLRYAEEAIAETRANQLMGRSLMQGLTFPLTHPYGITVLN